MKSTSTGAMRCLMLTPAIAENYARSPSRDRRSRGASTCVIVFALAILMTGVAPTAAASPPIRNADTTVFVSATQAWTDTGIDLSSGPIAIDASGSIKIAGSDPGKSPAGETNGVPFDVPGCIAGEGWTVPGAFCWTMVARIGENGQPFEVDNGLMLTATSGRLYLGVNDNAFGDNSGQWRAVVSVPQSQCPEILFAGVRGSGETATGDGLGYGVPVATHRWVLQREFDIRVQPIAVNYDAHAILGDDALDVANNLRSYEPSVDTGDAALRTLLARQITACPQTKIALAGYSQGANVIANWLTGPDAGPAPLAAIRDVTLYGNPRQSNQALSFERFVKVNEPTGYFFPTSYQGLATVLNNFYGTGYSQMTHNPLGERLNSWCTLTISDSADRTPILDPICGFPSSLVPQSAGDVQAAAQYVLDNYAGRHDAYQVVVPIAAPGVIDRLE